MLTDKISGKQMRALDVFTEAIKYIREFVFEKLDIKSLGPNKIAWVITVPAIWDNFAKDIMKTSARKVSCTNFQVYLFDENKIYWQYCF